MYNVKQISCSTTGKSPEDNSKFLRQRNILFHTRSISGCCSRSCTISAWPPLAAKCRGELSWPFSMFGLQLPFSSNSLVASTLPCLDGTKQNLVTTHQQDQNNIITYRGLQTFSRRPLDSPTCIVNGSPVVTVQLFD